MLMSASFSVRRPHKQAARDAEADRLRAEKPPALADLTNRQIVHGGTACATLEFCFENILVRSLLPSRLGTPSPPPLCAARGISAVSMLKLSPPE
jgi:hypothetical protein